MPEQFWQELLNNNGPLLLIIVAVGFAAWRIVKWAGPLFKDILIAHKNLVETLAVELPKQTAVQENTVRTNEGIAVLLEHHMKYEHSTFNEQHQEIKKDLEKIYAKVAEYKNGS